MIYLILQYSFSGTEVSYDEWLKLLDSKTAEVERVEQRPTLHYLFRRKVLFYFRVRGDKVEHFVELKDDSWFSSKKLRSKGIYVGAYDDPIFGILIYLIPILTFALLMRLLIRASKLVDTLGQQNK